MAEYLFDAFISYRHMKPDHLIARALHRKLENYRSPRPSQDRRIGKIFLDMLDLPLSSDLGNQITQALDCSKFLILICSPEYLQSKYCEAELAYFLQTHEDGRKHVLVVLTRGEPSQAFPEVLTTIDETMGKTGIFARIEPLGANVRARNWLTSLWKLRKEYLRIAAPILGLGFDDLYQRHRRRKRHKRIMVGMIALVLSGGLITYGMIKNQQVVAEVQKKQQQQADVVWAEVNGLLSNQQGDAVDTQKALLLASTYAAQPTLLDQPKVQVALRSAVAQSALNINAKAFPRVLYCDYPYETVGYSSAVFYYIAPNDTILFIDRKNAKRTLLLDAKTGATLRDIGESKVEMTGDCHYMTYLQNTPGVDGVSAQQSYTLLDLFQNQVIATHTFQSTTSIQSLRIGYCTNDGPFAIYNGDTLVLAYDRFGNEIDEAAYRAAIPDASDPLPVVNDLYHIRKNRTTMFVADTNNNACFSLPKGTQVYSFSRDFSQLAYGLDNQVHVLATADWSEVGVVPWGESEQLMGITLLSADSRLICLTLRKNDADSNTNANFVNIFNITTGDLVLHNEPGTPPDTQDGKRFYVCNAGKLSGFEPNQAYFDGKYPVFAINVAEHKALIYNDRQVQYINTEDGSILAQWDDINADIRSQGPSARQFVYADDFSAFLVQTGDGYVRLYDANGAPLWATQTDGDVTCLAIASDGESSAYSVDTFACVMNRTGTVQKQYPMAFKPTYLAVMDSLLYVADNDQGVLLRDGASSPLAGNLPFGQGELLDNQVVMFDEMDEQANLAICDDHGVRLFQSQDTVYAYCYANTTKYIAIQPLATNGYPSATIAVWDMSGETPEWLFDLPLGNQYDDFMFDETGEYLTTVGEEGTRIYRMVDGMLWLQASGVMGRFEDQQLYAVYATKGGVFSQALGEDAIAEYAKLQLTSVNGERVLQPAEKLFAE